MGKTFKLTCDRCYSLIVDTDCEENFNNHVSHHKVKIFIDEGHFQRPLYLCGSCKEELIKFCRGTRLER